ncbi:hypothetical protein [Aeromonas enteropelogenes]|uniref:hypothetical protein n=1 Tax=Aeromonas enteropelogenes TaxID=29489 RepID=UPI003B9EE2A8
MWFKFTVESVSYAKGLYDSVIVHADIFRWDDIFTRQGKSGHSAYSALSDDSQLVTYYLTFEFEELIEKYGAVISKKTSYVLEGNLRRII